MPDASEAFINNLNKNEINQFVDKVNCISQNDISQEEVETLVSECSSLLLNAADAAGMIKNKTIREVSNRVERKHNSVKRPWFNANCQKLHLQYRRLKNHRRRVNELENYRLLSNASMDYKKCLNQHFNAYKKDFIKKLCALKNSDAKAYWKLLNKSDSSNSNTIQKVSLATFADHLKKTQYNFKREL